MKSKIPTTNVNSNRAFERTYASKYTVSVDSSKYNRYNNHWSLFEVAPQLIPMNNGN